MPRPPAAAGSGSELVGSIVAATDGAQTAPASLANTWPSGARRTPNRMCVERASVKLQAPRPGQKNVDHRPGECQESADDRRIHARLCPGGKEWAERVSKIRQPPLQSRHLLCVGAEACRTQRASASHTPAPLVIKLVEPDLHWLARNHPRP